MSHSTQRPPGLLVSVRSAAEARHALAGGADLIDIKDPSRGALGRANPETIAAVLAAVAGQRPVSAALGELTEEDLPPPPAGLAYVKWGFAGWGGRIEGAPAGIARCGAAAVILTAYADWPRAQAPEPEEIAALALASGAAGLLLDTFQKDGTTLLDWMTPDQLASLVGRCRAGGLRIALAGSLGVAQISALAHLRPDWFAVRGAACRRGDRGAAIDPEQVRALAALVRGLRCPAGANADRAVC